MTTTASRTYLYVPPPRGGATGLPATIPGETTVEVNIGQRPFLIGVGDTANARRQRYFAGEGLTLLQQEKELLDYYKIDETSDALRALLPEFFRSLPRCQSDTNVFLKKGCEPVYQLLWMAKMSRATKGAAEMRAVETALAPLGGIVTSVELAHLETLINQFDQTLLRARLLRLGQGI